MGDDEVRSTEREERGTHGSVPGPRLLDRQPQPPGYRVQVHCEQCQRNQRLGYGLKHRALPRRIASIHLKGRCRRPASLGIRKVDHLGHVAQSIRLPSPSGDPREPKWRQAPQGLATRRQLRAMGLRPGGHDPVAQVECRGGKRVAYLYRVDLALPKLPMTLAKEAALDKAMAARQTCPRCSRRYFTCLPLKTLGSCLLRTTGDVWLCSREPTAPVHEIGQHSKLC